MVSSLKPVMDQFGPNWPLLATGGCGADDQLADHGAAGLGVLVEALVAGLVARAADSPAAIAAMSVVRSFTGFSCRGERAEGLRTAAINDCFF
jgi:hypothetical protein